MKVRFPIYAQILAFLMLQLTLLAAVFLIFFNSRFGLGWGALVDSPVGERLQAIAWVIHRQTQGRPESTWNSVLEEFGRYYGVKFYLFDCRGHQLSGDPVHLPAAVAERTMAPPPRPPFDGDRLPAAEPPERLDALIPPHPSFARPPGRFVVHTNTPDCYWLGVRMFLHDPPPPPGIAPSSGKAGTPEVSMVPPPGAMPPPGAPGAPPAFGTLPLGMPPPPEPPGTLLAASGNLWQTRLFLDFELFLAGAAGVLFLSLLIWWPFVHRLTGKLAQLTAATQRIASGSFDTRLKASRWDEIGRLADAVNSMAGRLSSFVTGQKRFLGDIAHELCSPIARLQVALALLERSAGTGQERAIADIREEVEEMRSLINELLAFSKAGLRGRQTQMVPLDLEDLLKAVVVRVASDNSVGVSVSHSLCVLGDRVLLERALANVLRNAVRYAGSCGPIDVKAVRAGADALITITDSGPGVPPEVLGLLGEPFYRPESSRDRSSGGAGLGLAIVKTCVEACDGSFSVRNHQPGGLEVEIRLRACNRAL